MISDTILALVNATGGVSGIKVSYDQSEGLKPISREALPCSVVVLLGQANGKPVRYDKSIGELRFDVRQIILYAVAPFGDSAPLSSMTVLLDACLIVFEHSSSLDRLLHTEIRMGILDWQGGSYHTIEFLHSFEIKL